MELAALDMIYSINCVCVSFVIVKKNDVTLRNGEWGYNHVIALQRLEGELKFPIFFFRYVIYRLHLLVRSRIILQNSSFTFQLNCPNL